MIPVSDMLTGANSNPSSVCIVVQEDPPSPPQIEELEIKDVLAEIVAMKDKMDAHHEELKVATDDTLRIVRDVRGTVTQTLSVVRKPLKTESVNVVPPLKVLATAAGPSRALTIKGGEGAKKPGEPLKVLQVKRPPPEDQRPANKRSK